MEDTTVLDSADYGGVTEEIRLTNESLGYLKETAKWGTFLAIMGFIGIGFMILVGVVMALFMSSMDLPGMEAFGSMNMVGFGFIYVIFGAVYIYPILKLLQFGSKCKKAIAQSSTDLMTVALGNLKSCFKFTGILMVILLGFYGLLFVFGGVLAAFV